MSESNDWLRGHKWTDEEMEKMGLTGAAPLAFVAANLTSTAVIDPSTVSTMVLNQADASVTGTVNVDTDSDVAVPDDPPHSTEAPDRLVSTGQPKITGYRELSPAEVALMQRIKAFGTEAEELTEAVADFLYEEQEGGRLKLQRESIRGVQEVDLTAMGMRWLEEGTVELQKALMFLVRAVARPTSF